MHSISCPESYLKGVVIAVISDINFLCRETQNFSAWLQNFPAGRGFLVAAMSCYSTARGFLSVAPCWIKVFLCSAHLSSIIFTIYRLLFFIPCFFLATWAKQSLAERKWLDSALCALPETFTILWLTRIKPHWKLQNLPPECPAIPEDIGVSHLRILITLFFFPSSFSTVIWQLYPLIS